MPPITYHVLDRTNVHLLKDAEVFDNPVDADQLAAFLNDPGHLMLFACAGSRVVGMATGTILLHPDKKPMMFINEVGVEEHMRRKGIAAQLCRRLMAEGTARGYTGFWLATETDNTAARALYRALKARETTGIVVYDWGGVMD